MTELRNGLDVWRTVWVVVGLLSVGVALRLLVEYIKKAKRGENLRFRIYHVLLLSVGWSIVAIGVVAEMYTRIGRPPTWRVYWYPAGLVLVNAGLVVITKFVSKVGKSKRKPEEV